MNNPNNKFDCNNSCNNSCNFDCTDKCNFDCDFDCDCDCNNNGVGGVVDAKEVRCQRKEDRLLILILIFLYCQNVSTNSQYYRCVNSELLNFLMCSNRQLLCSILCMNQNLVCSVVDCCANQRKRK
jgi:hypothetical protein